ncbi:hypothetical protein N7486_007654 [Penicillium sp. IBT 16267x]|nr:hypothetical protein N7486_007654 [Penicillium sp. IBT 16267x]
MPTQSFGEERVADMIPVYTSVSSISKSAQTFQQRVAAVHKVKGTHGTKGSEMGGCCGADKWYTCDCSCKAGEEEEDEDPEKDTPLEYPGVNGQTVVVAGSPTPLLAIKASAPERVYWR